MPSTSYLTPPAIAKRYGVKPAKVLAWIRNGELVAINMAERSGGRPRWHVSPEALEAFELRRSSRPAPRAVRQKQPARKIPKYV